MSIPTFCGTQLFSLAPRDVPGSPRIRAYVESLPGVDGQFVQPGGIGARTIRAAGLLSGSNMTAELAAAWIKQKIRDLQALADGRTVGKYLGVDGHVYSNCMLQTYQAAGNVRVVGNSPTSFTAYVACRAILVQLTPDA